MRAAAWSGCWLLAAGCGGNDLYGQWAILAWRMDQAEVRDAGLLDLTDDPDLGGRALLRHAYGLLPDSADEVGFYPLSTPVELSVTYEEYAWRDDRELVLPLGVDQGNVFVYQTDRRGEVLILTSEADAYLVGCEVEIAPY